MPLVCTNAPTDKLTDTLLLGEKTLAQRQARVKLPFTLSANQKKPILASACYSTACVRDGSTAVSFDFVTVVGKGIVGEVDKFRVPTVSCCSIEVGSTVFFSMYTVCVCFQGLFRCFTFFELNNTIETAENAYHSEICAQEREAVKITSREASLSCALCRRARPFCFSSAVTVPLPQYEKDGGLVHAIICEDRNGYSTIPAVVRRCIEGQTKPPMKSVSKYTGGIVTVG